LYSTVRWRRTSHERSTDLRGHGVADAFLYAALCRVRPIRISDRDAHCNARYRPLSTVRSISQARHRLSRARNRRINRVLHIMAVVQLRNHTRGRTYYDARRAGGMPSMMAMRALKRRLSNVVFARMLADQKRREAGPGGQPGTPADSSAADPDPRTPALRTSHIRTRHSTA
jgi:hypothetical protein